jgi:DNA-directed RNA polymerase subunit RPC12/RpoP
MKPVFYRQTCLRCAQTVEFPPNNVGHQIPCPNCHLQMRLVKPRRWAATLTYAVTVSAIVGGSFVSQWPNEQDIPIEVLTARMQPLVEMRARQRLERQNQARLAQEAAAQERARQEALRAAELAANENARRDAEAKEAALKAEIQKQAYLASLEQRAIQLKRERERQAQAETQRIADREAKLRNDELNRIAAVQDYNRRVDEYNRAVQFQNQAEWQRYQADYNAAVLTEMQKANAIRQQQFLHPGYKRVVIGNSEVILPSNVPVFPR